MANPNLQTDLKQDWINNEVVMPADVNEWAERINNLNEVIPIYAATGNFYTATYSNNVYNLQPCSFEDNTQNVTPSSYIDGMSVCFKIPETNLTQCKININNLGEKYIKLINNTNIPSNYFNLNEYTLLKYDAENDCFYVDNNNCSNRDLSNLTATGEKHFVNKTQLPPGVLEVPQNIKYTLNNGTFTLKAGSILTVPYGTTDQSATYPVGATFLNNNFKVADTSFYSGKFFVMAEVQADISISSLNIYPVDTFLTIKLSGNSFAYFGQSRVKSGTTQPTGADLWYNTSTNRFLYIQSSPTQENHSFPIAAIRRDSGTVDSVLRVFNGFGYLGKAIWINKGVTMLCPNGKNTDGTNNNMVKTSDEVFVIETTSATGTFLLMRGQNNNTVRFSGLHYIQQSEPQPSSDSATWYNPALNKTLLTSNKGVDWTELSYSPIGTLKIVDSSFLSFDDAVAFVAADDNAVVHNYGNEEINGAKTFNDAMTANSTITVYGEIFSYTNTNRWQEVVYKNLALDITEPPAIAYGGRLISYDKNGVYFGTNEHGFSNNTIYNRMRAHKVVDGVDKLSDVAAYIDNSGNCYGVAPTYTANYADSSTKIVTTAYMANHWTTSKATTSSTASKARPAVVIQNYVSGYNWYRVWSDGWIEQGGRVYMNNAINQTLNFNKAFTTTNYTIVSAGEGGNADVNLGIMERHTAYVIVDNGHTEDYNWYACGY